ncbi:TonB-dependent siderophore receptor [Massilia sp. H6]|uniref:TonB-dependent receptor n=1 Tax=Massilia sp. H6 TaxID=2970464 RepID=UPI0021691A68|nr:TonB-dependent siderophore receptor [Massilia sp. H6]UVW29468.1 TonB-dependent siderophore receptor [Massilia sp. H6]
MPKSFTLSPSRIALAVAGTLISSVGYADDESRVIPKVQVTAPFESSYVDNRPVQALKSDAPLLDVPQAVTVITRQLMDDQAMQSIADAIRYVPGIVTAQGEGNRDAAVFRGNASTGDFYIDGIRDDVQYYRDFYNIERVEAVKGANAMIFGRGGSGGVINRTSKQAGGERIREAVVTVGSHDHKRVAVDLGDQVNANVALRINAMAEQSDSYRNGVEIERKGINPVMTWQAGANTSVSVGYEHFRDDRIADRGIPSFNGRPFETDVSTFFGNAEQSPTAVRVDALTAYLEHGFANGLVLRNRTRFADYDKFYQNVYANSSVSPTTGRLGIGAYHDATQRRNRFNQTDLNYTISTGSVRHKLAAGLELGRQETDNVRRAGVFPAASPSVAATDPRYTATVAFPAPTTSNHSVANITSVYLQDHIELSPQWHVVAGLRHDRFSVDFRNRLAGSNGAFKVTDTPFSPRAGLIYKPLEAMSVYASVSRAYVPRAGDQLTSLTASNRAFEPEQFDNTEIGVKWDLHQSLSASAAVYKLDRTNVVVPGPVTGTSILVDGQTTRGLELELAGQLTPSWNVMGGYAYQDAELTANQSATVRSGAKLAMVPKHTFSLWNRYNLNQQWGVGLGVVYRDSLYTSTTNTTMLPSFTRVDGALYYRIDKQLRLQLNVENLFDKKYYASAHNDNNITPGAPRSVKLSLHAGF